MEDDVLGHAAQGLASKLKEYSKQRMRKNLFESTQQKVLSTLKKPNCLQEWNEILKAILADDETAVMQFEKLRHRRIHQRSVNGLAEQFLDGTSTTEQILMGNSNKE